jgi:hypothetical protein
MTRAVSSRRNVGLSSSFLQRTFFFCNKMKPLNRGKIVLTFDTPGLPVSIFSLSNFLIYILVSINAVF